MADDLEDEYEEGMDDGDDRPSGGGKKKLLLILVPLLLLIGGLAAAYFTGLADPLLGRGGDQPPPPPPTAGAPVRTPGEVQAAVFYDLPEMLVDLSSADPRRRTFLKLRVSLELTSVADTMIVDANMPRVIDSFQVYLRELRVEDLQGSAGMYRLREELLQRVNSAVRPARVEDVLFRDMLIQ